MNIAVTKSIWSESGLSLATGLFELSSWGGVGGVHSNKGDSRPRHLVGKVVNTGLVRQTWGMSLFGPM